MTENNGLELHLHEKFQIASFNLKVDNLNEKDAKTLLKEIFELYLTTKSTYNAILKQAIVGDNVK
jgi:hypothetical protein